VVGNLVDIFDDSDFFCISNIVLLLCRYIKRGYIIVKNMKANYVNENEDNNNSTIVDCDVERSRTTKMKKMKEK